MIQVSGRYQAGRYQADIRHRDTGRYRVSGRYRYRVSGRYQAGIRYQVSGIGIGIRPVSGRYQAGIRQISGIVIPVGIAYQADIGIAYQAGIGIAYQAGIRPVSGIRYQVSVSVSGRYQAGIRRVPCPLPQALPVSRPRCTMLCLHSCRR
jgi:hypothetical protein